MGVWALIFGGMMPFGSLGAGVLARFVGVPLTIVAGAVICALAAAVTLAVIRLRERTSAKAPPAP